MLSTNPATATNTTTTSSSNNNDMSNSVAQDGPCGRVTKANKRPLLEDVNPIITCVLCGGYFVDATTIVECLDTFCKSCIVRYLETSKSCPICDVPLNKNKPWQSLREDKLRQDIVYKLVPQVFKDEMKRRQHFYANHKDEEPFTEEDAGLVNQTMNYFRPNDKISMSLEYDHGDMIQNGFNSTSCTKSKPSAANKVKSNDESVKANATPTKDDNANKDSPTRRYLLCPAGLSILQLKKFISNKYGLIHTYKVDIFYAGECLYDDFTLMDVAYIYSWGRNDPMRFYFRIMERPIKHLKAIENSRFIEQSSSPGNVDSHNTGHSASRSVSTGAKTVDTKLNRPNGHGKVQKVEHTNSNSQSLTSTTTNKSSPTVRVSGKNSNTKTSSRSLMSNNENKQQSLKRPIEPDSDTTSSTVSNSSTQSSTTSSSSSKRQRTSASSNSKSASNTIFTSRSNTSKQSSKDSLFTKSASSSSANRSRTGDSTNARPSRSSNSSTSTASSHHTSSAVKGEKPVPSANVSSAKPATVKVIPRASVPSDSKGSVSQKGRDNSSITTSGTVKNESTSAASVSLSTTSRVFIGTKSAAFNVRNLIDQNNGSKDRKVSDKLKPYVSISPVVSGNKLASVKSSSQSNVTSSSSAPTSKSQCNSSSSSLKVATSKPMLLSTTTTSQQQHSSSKSTTSPLSPPAIRIKLTTSPNHSSSSSSKQLIGQIISPIPPEVANELSKHSSSSSHSNSSSSSKESRSSWTPSESKHSKSSNSSGSTTSHRFKTVTSQGVQSYAPAGNARPRGEMIHQIINKMTSKGSFKSSCVNVSSTTPSLESLISKNKHKSSSGSHSSQSKSITSDEADNKVTTTTNDSSSSNNLTCQQQTSPTTGARSSGNLVLRISTKSLESKAVSSNSLPESCSPSSSGAPPSSPSVVSLSSPSSTSTAAVDHIKSDSKVSSDKAKVPSSQCSGLSDNKTWTPSSPQQSSKGSPSSSVVGKSDPSPVNKNNDSIDMEDDNSIDGERKLVVDMGDSECDVNEEIIVVDGENNAESVVVDVVGSDCEDSGRGSSSSVNDVGTVRPDPVNTTQSSRLIDNVGSPSSQQPSSSTKSPPASSPLAVNALVGLASPPPTPSPRSDTGSMLSAEMGLNETVPESTAKKPSPSTSPLSEASDSKINDKPVPSEKPVKVNSVTKKSANGSQTTNVPLDLSMSTVKKVSPISSPTKELTNNANLSSMALIRGFGSGDLNSQAKFLASLSSSQTKQQQKQLNDNSIQNFLSSSINANHNSLANLFPISSNITSDSPTTHTHLSHPSFPGLPHPLPSNYSFMSHLAASAGSPPGSAFDPLSLLNHVRTFPANITAAAIASLINSSSPSTGVKNKSSNSSKGINNYSRLLSAGPNTSVNKFFDGSNLLTNGNPSGSKSSARNGMSSGSKTHSTTASTSSSTSVASNSKYGSRTSSITTSSTSKSTKPSVTIRTVSSTNPILPLSYKFHH